MSNSSFLPLSKLVLKESIYSHPLISTQSNLLPLKVEKEIKKELNLIDPEQCFVIFLHIL